MKLMILTCACFPTEAEARRKLWIFGKSCEKFIPQEHIFWYGVARTFPGYRAMMLDWQLDFLREQQYGYTHVLFTDSWDAFFTAPYSEIVEKYESLDAPPVLASAYWQLGNAHESDYPGCFDHSHRNCFPNRGGYIAELPVIIDAFKRMLKLPRVSGDDALSWYDAWAEGWFRPALDHDAQIFQISTDDCSVRDGRLYNTRLKTNPCILHISGGYTDQETGKDDRLKPWAKELGVIE